ncbi:MAG: PTS lactose transporter subunit IIB [Chloroflexi bacterium]|nr:PTS lactose transporter subunit IIB [Chloroflexota bacterium]
MAKLIAVVCGAGINTSTIAEDQIREKVEREGLRDVEVKRILYPDIERFIGMMTVVVSMTKIFRTDLGAPTVQGMPFLIGTKEEKEALLDKIIQMVKAA